jgi:hypothetical protein
MDRNGRCGKINLVNQYVEWISMDGCGWLLMPSHGGNTGSNPVGDANNIIDLYRDILDGVQQMSNI